MSLDAHQIPLADAAELTNNFRNTVAGTVALALTGQKGQMFDKDAIQAVLNQTGVTGIRVYYGLDLIPPAFKLIMVGVDSSGNDVTSGIIIDKGITCPNVCSTNNVLNTNP